MKRFNKIVGIDATWLLRRQFHAVDKCKINKVPATETEPEKFDQDPNIAVISFLQCVLKKIREVDYQYQIVCLWDRGTYRYRPKEKFTGYKESREYDNSYEACWEANNILVPLLRTIGIDSVQVGGLEADDLGMLFSHNTDDCILWAIDSDWHQSITESTVIMNHKGILKYEDIVTSYIKHPFDLAIDKAIRGGHDDLKKVDLSDHVEIADLFKGDEFYGKIIESYKNRALNQDVLDAIDYNMHLSRLDKVLDDTDVHKMVEEQLAMTTYHANNFSLLQKLSAIPNYPQYFLGVLTKYNKLHKK